MPPAPQPCDPDTGRISPEALAAAAEAAAYRVAAKTDVHRALGVVVHGLPLPSDEDPPAAEPPRPWWWFWGR
jgi:hypothetical protein